jgi:hypothetical protein
MSAELIQHYLKHNFRIVLWPAIGDAKGPRDKGWTEHVYTLEEYQPGYRVGLMTGVEIYPGKFFTDTDLDWAPGCFIALAFLPSTEFVFGRASKKISHCCYTLPIALPSFRFEDLDGTCLIEIRGTKSNGEIGLQTMVPPSVWSKDNLREALAFVKAGGPTHLEVAEYYVQRVTLSAIGMIFARNFGKNGFGHEVRLMWAGYLLRLGISVEDLVLMGEKMSVLCENREVGDVRRVVESTAARLTDAKQKIKGGPALAKHLGANGNKLIARINEWLGRESGFVRTERGIIVANHQGNIQMAVATLGKELSYNQFSDKLLIDGTPLEDRQMNALYLQVDEELHFRPAKEFFQMVVEHIAWTNGFHPVRTYLNGLVWDQVPRINFWLRDLAGAQDSEYLRAISAIFLIAAVRRVRKPGCKFDELIVLEGKQGLNKSSALRALCPEGEWFSDDFPLNMRSQQLIEATKGKWILEAADLAGKRKAEIEQLKATLSRQSDGPARMAYDRLPIERDRQFVVAGTTNSKAYLTDSTGARRFWPTEIQRFDVEGLLKVRDQLWAEACVREALGESIRLAEELWPEAAKEQEERREIDPWERTIRALLLSLDPSGDGRRRVLTSAIWLALNIEPFKQDRTGATRISEIMQRLGFKRTKVRGPEGVEVGYISEDDKLLHLESEHQEVLPSLPDARLPESLKRKKDDDDVPF